jgi:predicted rRNA methylase YqxC with S4 and FtsJ domains
MANKDCKISGNVPRAYYKLQEAFERFFGDTEDYDCSGSLLKNKVALDCGAAPGGWTLYLMEQGCHKVYSIDPGNLYPSVLRIVGVEHFQMKLQDALLILPRNSIDIFVSDMCLHEMEAHVDMLLEAKPLLLKPNTLFVMTLKCVAGHLDSSCDSQVQKQVSRLDQVAYGVKTMHLFVNRRRERTVMGYLR